MNCWRSRVYGTVRACRRELARVWEFARFSWSRDKSDTWLLWRKFLHVSLGKRRIDDTAVRQEKVLGVWLCEAAWVDVG